MSLEIGIMSLEIGLMSLEMESVSLEMGLMSLEMGVMSLEMGLMSLEMGLMSVEMVSVSLENGWQQGRRRRIMGSVFSRAPAPGRSQHTPLRDVRAPKGGTRPIQKDVAHSADLRRQHPSSVEERLRHRRQPQPAAVDLLPQPIRMCLVETIG
jgi:hypothetical protein